MLQKLFFSFLIFTFFAPFAFAGVLVEPMLGYLVSGKATTTDTKHFATDTDFEAKYSGVNYGGRLGLYYLGFMMGAQYDTTKASKFKTEKPTNQSFVDSEGTITNMSVFAGFNFPLGLRVFGNYYFTSKVKGTKEVNGSSTYADKDEEYSGTGLGLGLGYRLPLLPVAFNVEYRTLTYTDYKYKSSGTLTKETCKNYFGNDMKANDILVTVSFPFTFL